MPLPLLTCLCRGLPPLGRRLEHRSPSCHRHSNKSSRCRRESRGAARCVRSLSPVLVNPRTGGAGAMWRRLSPVHKWEGEAVETSEEPHTWWQSSGVSRHRDESLECDNTCESMQSPPHIGTVQRRGQWTAGLHPFSSASLVTTTTLSLHPYATQDWQAVQWALAALSGAIDTHVHRCSRAEYVISKTHSFPRDCS